MADQNLGKHRKGQKPPVGGHRKEQPVYRHRGAATQVLDPLQRVSRLDPPRFTPARLPRYRRRNFALTKAGEKLPVQKGQVLLGGNITVEHNTGVGRVVVAAVERHKLLVGQPGNDGGVSAGVVAVEDVRKERLEALLRYHRVVAGVVSLHLVVDYPRPFQSIAGGPAIGGPSPAIAGPKLQPVALLAEELTFQQREKDGVPVDLHHVEEIGGHRAGRRIHRLVRKGHGV